MNMRRLNIALMALVSFGALQGLLAVPAYQALDAADGGIWIGRFNLAPTLDFGVFYDSNPDEVNESRRRLMEVGEGVEGDRFDSATGYNIQPGLNLLVPGNNWKLNGRAYYVYEKDDSDYTRAPKDWMEYLTLNGETEGGIAWGLGQSLQQLRYEKFDEFSQEDRFATRLNGNVGKELTEKSKLSLGANYSSVEYDDDFAYDTEYLTFALSFSHRLTEKTDGILSGSYGIKGSEEEDSDAYEYNLSVGLSAEVTEKLAYRTLIGVSMYEDFEYANADPEAASSSETDYSLSYSLGIQWKPTERIAVNVSGGSGYESAEDVRSDSLLAYTLVSSVDYRLYRRILLSGGLAYRYEDYLRDVAEANNGEDVYVGTDTGGTSRQDSQVNAYAGVTFGLNKYASLFAHGLYSVTDSTIEDFEYDRYRISAGVALQY
jgi:hypothetical protein